MKNALKTVSITILWIFAFVLVILFANQKNIASKEEKVGIVHSIGRIGEEAKKVAYMKNGDEVYVLDFPAIDSQLRYFHYKGMFNYEWNSTY